jgi:hypothetical protein
MSPAGGTEALIEEIEDEQAALRPLAGKAPALELEVADLDRRIADVESSASWRATLPLRAVQTVIANRRRLARAAGRHLKAHLER